MFHIEFGNDGEIVCSGRLDAAQCEKAQSFMDNVSEARVVDFGSLEYISSAGSINSDFQQTVVFVQNNSLDVC